MAVVGVPGYIGSSAVNETGQRYMSAARSALRLSAYGGYMTEMAGRTKEIEISIQANHNFDWASLVNEINSRGVAGNAFKVTVYGDLVSYTTGQPTLYFPASLGSCAYIKIVNNATLYGRGGNGGGPQTSHGGKNGGVCITNEIGGKLQIENNGAICGGGGGGGDVGLGGDRRTVAGGSGGRPFGQGGAADYNGNGGRTNGNTASLEYPGARTASVNYGNNQGGAGGDVGANGEGGIAYGADAQTAYGGGAAGAAVNGNSPTWLRIGTVFGSRV